MGLFRRRRRSIASQLAKAQALRSSSLALQVDELPITQGLAQLHADLVSSLELQAVDRNGKVLTNQPELLVRPDETEDREDTLHKMVQALWWGGNATASVAGAGAASASLHVLNPHSVGYEPDPYDSTLLRHWYVDGHPYPLDRLKNWKVNDDPRRGPLGRSPLVSCADALNLYGWAYRYLLDYFAQGGNPSLVLRSRRNLSPGAVEGDTAGRTEAQIAQDDWVAARQAYRPAVLDPMWELENGPDPQDLEQVVKVLEFAAVEVGRLANVPPSIGNMMSSGSLTYSTTADELRRWLLLGLGPTWLKRLERGFTALLPAGMFARFDQDSLTRFDVLENAAATASAPVTQLRAIA